MTEKYFVLEVPYAEQESAFLLDVLHTAITAHRECHKNGRGIEPDKTGESKADGNNGLNLTAIAWG